MDRAQLSVRALNILDDAILLSILCPSLGKFLRVAPLPTTK
nr:MAG TPA: hypothetical protein [Caudoviricetes sp.]